MSEFDFDKEFADHIRKERLFEPTDAEWDKVAAELDASEAQKRRRRRIFLWAVPLAASAAFAFLGIALLRAYTRVGAMQVEITRLKIQVADKSSITLTDTSVRHFSVIQYDTVYRRTVVVQNPMTWGVGQGEYRNDIDLTDKPELQKSNIRSTVSFLDEKKNIETRIREGANTEPSPHVSTADSLGAIKNDQSGITLGSEPAMAKIKYPDTDSTARDNDLTSIKPLPSIQLQGLQNKEKYRLPDMGLLLIPAPTESRHDKLIRRFRPHDVTAGITGGMVFPQTQSAKPLDTYSAGLTGELAFGRHIRLRGSAEYVPTQFRVTPAGQIELNIPLLTPPTPNDVLNYVQIKQPLWDFSLGLRYAFVPEKRLRPFISAAWVGEKTLEQTLQYEFKNQVTEEEIFIRVPRAESRFNANGLRLGLGVEWALTNRLSFQLEGTYQRQSSTAAPLLAERWGVKAGVAYSL